MDNIYVNALKEGKKVYDNNGRQYVWDDENNTIKVYSYIDSDAIISSCKTLDIDQFVSKTDKEHLTISK
jgi:hypothetical protein